MATATLALSRKGRIFGHGHAWQILLDGKPAGSIANDDAARLPVEAGHHALRLSSGRFTSPERSFDAADGQVVSFTCHAPLIWPQAAAAVVVPGLRISPKASSE
jgi:hypothetical protein